LSDDDYGPWELVVAVAENDVIGRANELPWRLPADLKHFRKLTMGHHILMGARPMSRSARHCPAEPTGC